MLEANTSSPPGSTPAAPANRNRWASVKSRGQVICGVSGEVPGFSFVGTDGKYSGIDVDVCRVIARIKTRVILILYNRDMRILTIQHSRIKDISR